MFLTEEARHRLLTYALPKYKVKRSVDGFWRVTVGWDIMPLAVFVDWRDALDFAAMKAAS